MSQTTIDRRILKLAKRDLNRSNLSQLTLHNANFVDHQERLKTEQLKISSLTLEMKAYLLKVKNRSPNSYQMQPKNLMERHQL